MKSESISIVDFEEDLAPSFYDINVEWISSMFVVEEADLKTMKDPKSAIIDKGGVILFAKTEDLGVIGTGALMKTADGTYELTKMGVLEKARGRKAGEILLQALIDRAKDMRIEYLYLLTNTKCQAAIHLYEKNGFVHDAETMDRFGKSYERCNVAMRYKGTGV